MEAAQGIRELGAARPSTEIWDLLGMLNQDLCHAWTVLGREDTPYNRRAYVRAAIALVEAMTFFLKQEALRHLGTGLFCHGQEALLLEKTYNLDKGKVVAQTKFLPLEQNFCFAVAMYANAMKSPFVLEKGREWEAFKNAIQARHRITHPKRADLLQISDTELRDVETACNWALGAIVHTVAQGANVLYSRVRELAVTHGIGVPPEVETLRP